MGLAGARHPGKPWLGFLADKTGAALSASPFQPD